MLDTDTFATTLYVMVDDFLKTQKLPPPTVGAPASLCPSEVVTLALLGQWRRFASERDFYRFAQMHLRRAFPGLPSRPQLNRLIRNQRQSICAFFLHLAERLGAASAPFQAMDCTALVTRCAKRRGAGWLFGQADIGYSNRLGWYEGLHLLLSVTPEGAIAGFAFGPASAKDQALAEDFLAQRARQGGLAPGLRAPGVGAAFAGAYLTDAGFEGADRHRRWRELGADVLTPPKRGDLRQWPKPLRRWLAGLRQVVETVNERLLHTFGLDRERPHALTGVWARLCAKMALHNFCFWLNGQLGRPRLAFADLWDW
jgi:hypothetical protein